MYRPRESREPTASSDWQKVWFLAHEALEMTFDQHVRRPCSRRQRAGSRPPMPEHLSLAKAER